MRSNWKLPLDGNDAQAQHNVAEAMLALIPSIPHTTPLFLQNETNDPWEECYSAHTSWDELSNPVTAVPDDHIGLDNLRELARQSLTTVIPYNTPIHSAHLLKSAHQLLAAGPVVYTKPGSRRKNLPGVVLHPGNSTLTAHVRGVANPHLGYGHKHGWNKLREWVFASQIDPTVMPETIAIDELPIWRYPKLDVIRRLIRNEMESIVDCRSSAFTNYAVQLLYTYMEIIFLELRIKFPNGALASGLMILV